MQGFDENSISKIKVYGRKGKMEAEAAHKSGGYLLSHNAVQYHRRC